MQDSKSSVIPAVKLPGTSAELAGPIRDRWSPRAFLDKPVTQETLRTLLEAGRWAASSSNEQPWRFIVARKEEPEEFARLLSVLVERNQMWARRAAVLLLSVGKKTMTTSGKLNRFALFDTGAAAATICIQAASMGLEAHQMGGYDGARARELFGVPEDFEMGAAMALGYPGVVESLPEDFRKGEVAPRTRKTLNELAFTTTWGTPAVL